MKTTYLILSLLFLSSLLNAQTTISLVSVDSIIRSMDGYEQKTTRQDSLTKAYSNEIAMGRQTLDLRLRALLEPYMPQEKEDLAAIRQRMRAEDLGTLSEIIQENELLLLKSQNFQALLSKREQDELEPFYDRARRALRYYATKNKIDLVMTIEEAGKSIVHLSKKSYATKAIIALLGTKPFSS